MTLQIGHCHRGGGRLRSFLEAFLRCDENEKYFHKKEIVYGRP